MKTGRNLQEVLVELDRQNKAKTGTNTSDDVYNKWYEKVYEPQAEAASVTDPVEDEPQG